ncbi:SRPBCC family protein [Nocardia mikamii]|uniref:SRPBCC family protein n=1 Tax=Nocardia mikamii TaxID=508464 RepID=UPI0007A4DF6C|nr:SRPBCC family protein [Nocardia mikamii]
MPVDVTTTIEIGRDRQQVADYAMDPANATAWYRNIDSARLLTPGPLAVGSAMAFEARFLGRSLAYTYTVVVLEPGRRLVMASADGPFPMETTYAFEDTPTGSTIMTLRNRGEPAGFSGLVAPLMAPAMRSANRKDLQQLKAVIEAAQPGS